MAPDTKVVIWVQSSKVFKLLELLDIWLRSYQKSANLVQLYDSGQFNWH